VNEIAQTDGEDRRSFLARTSSALMVFGLAAGYGLFATLMGWFLFPRHGQRKLWHYLVDLPSFRLGESLTYTSPNGQKVAVTRTGEEGTQQDFIALSSICPHLGCQVHWEVQNNRFFCPCHNGAFDPEGNPIAGPPKDAGQSLARYPLKVENNLLFIQVEAESLIKAS